MNSLEADDIENMLSDWNDNTHPGHWIDYMKRLLMEM